MKSHRTLIIRTLRSMAASSSGGSDLCKSLRQNQLSSALVNPQIARFCFRPIINNIYTFSSATATTNSAHRWPKEARMLCSAAGKCMVAGNNEYNGDVSSLANTAWTIRSGIAKYPRPENVPWQKEFANRTDFIGRIGGPVQLKHTKSGKSLAMTSIGVCPGSQQQTMWFKLVFWNELAETAARHLKMNDIVHVSGYLGLQITAGEDDKLQRYQVVALTLNFIKKKSPDLKNSPDLKKSPYIPSSSSQNAQEYAAFIESLWQAYFNNPHEWWDNRINKINPRSPDFKHKDTGEPLWISSKSNPSWVKSQLAVLDSRMKVLEEWGKVGSSARSQGSLSSSQASGF